MGAYAEIQREQNLGNPPAGQFAMGTGVTTSQLQNPNVTLEHHTPKGPWYQNSPGVFLAIVAALVLLAWGHRHHEGEYKRIRVGFDSWLVGGMMVATFIYAAKVGTTAAGPMVPKPIRDFFGAL